jgi:hypothetical protein
MDISVAPYTAPAEENPFTDWLEENLAKIEKEGSVKLTVTEEEKGKALKLFRAAARANERSARLRETLEDDGKLVLVFTLGPKSHHPGRGGKKDVK